MRTVLAICLSGACLLSLVSGASVIVPSGSIDYWTLPSPDSVQDETSRVWTPPLHKVIYTRNSYGPPESIFIDNVAATIEGLTKGCIAFTPRALSANPQFYLNIKKATDDAEAAPAQCSALTYGRDTAMTSGQDVIAFGGESKGSCLTDVRDLTRIFLNVLGLGSEYTRTAAERDQGIRMVSNYKELMEESLDDPFNENTLLTNPITPFDIKSITMVSPTRFSKTGDDALFSIRYGQQIESELKLSSGDCQALNAMYYCNLDCLNPEIYPPVNQAPTVSPPVSIPTTSIETSINCWPTGETGPIAAADLETGGIGRLKVIPSSAYGDHKNWTTDSSDLGDNSQLTHDPDFSHLTVGLATKISAGTSSKLTIKGVDSELNEVFNSGEIEISVNCLPQYVVPCADPALEGKCPVVGTPGTQEDQVVPTPIELNIAACVDGFVQPNVFIGDFVISDPDEDQTPVFLDSSFESVTTDSSDTQVVSTNAWYWFQKPNMVRGETTGQVVFGGATDASGNVPLKAPLNVRVSFASMDGQYEGIGRVVVNYKIDCDPTRKPQHTRALSGRRLSFLKSKKH